MKKQKSNSYPEEFLEICKWVDEKLKRERNILGLEILEKKQSQMLIWAIILLMIFIIVVFSDLVVKKAAIGVLVLAFIGLIIYTILSNIKILRKKVELKKIILEEFAVHLKNGFTFEGNGEISESKYRKSGFNRNYNEFISNSYMYGNIDGRNIGMANVLVKRSLNDKKENSKLIFNGLFSYIDLNNFFKEIDLMKVNSKSNKKEKISFSEDNLYMYVEDRNYGKLIIDNEVIQLLRQIKKELDTSLELMINKDTLYMRFFMTDVNNSILLASDEGKKYLYKYYRIVEIMKQLADIIERKISLKDFRIYPKIDSKNYSSEFTRKIEKAQGVEIQCFEENGSVAEFDIKERVEKIHERYPNLKEMTLHVPISDYEIEVVAFKNEKIILKQLQEILVVSKKYNITVNLLYHTQWNLSRIVASGLIEKIRKYAKMLEGSSSKLLIENIYMIEEKKCTPLDVCEYIDHPNLKACIDIAHIYCKTNIYKTNILDFIKEYLDKDACKKYVYQIHFSAALENDGYIKKNTHGRKHPSEEDMVFDLDWMKEYNLLNKVFVTEISEYDYVLRTDQVEEINMLEEQIKRYV